MTEQTAPTHTGPDPGPIFSLATGYWSSMTLLAGSELGVFGALASGPASAAAVAGVIGTDARATAMLLDALTGLGLLTKSSDAYALTPASAAFLSPDSPAYLGSALRWSRDQYDAWGDLAAAVRSGKPAVDPSLHLGDDPRQTRDFVVGMHERAKGVARGVTPHIDLGRAKSLLDVGGGPGTYAVLLAQRSPDLTVTVLDLPGIAAVGSELVAAAGMADRVRFAGGDATSGEYGDSRYDAVLFSGVLHQMSPATIQRMFAGAVRALSAGGRVVVSDMMLDSTKTQPPFSTLFSLLMLLTSREGAVFASEDCAAWLSAAGFADVDIRLLPPPLPYTVVSGRKGT